VTAAAREVAAEGIAAEQSFPAFSLGLIWPSCWEVGAAARLAVHSLRAHSLRHPWRPSSWLLWTCFSSAFCCSLQELPNKIECFEFSGE